MTTDSEEYGSPWYQNFWPWFIVGLLGFSVVGSLLSVAIAYRTRDVDVRIRPPVEAPTSPSSSPSSSSAAADRESRDSGR
jgi:hypothetical protein